MQRQLIHHLDRLAADRWARQGLRTLLRACWLAACIWCIGLGGHLVWGWPLRFGALAIISLGLIGASVILLLRPKLPPHEVARRLDRRFHLDEQLSTAVEMVRVQPEQGSLAARLVVESSQTAALVSRRILRQQAAPWSEAITLAALVLVVIGLLVIVGIGRPDISLIGASAAPLPGLASPQDAQSPPEEPFTPPSGGPQGAPGTGDQIAPGSGPSDPQVLGAIADALRDQGATRPAAEALDQGDVAGAAQSLRELADQASQLSDQAREDLADQLQNAANQIEGRNEALADQLRQSANGLENGGQSASQALENLARALEQLGGPGENPGDQGQQPPPDSQGQGDQGQGDQQAPGQGQQDQGQQQGQGQGDGSGGTGNGAAGEQRQSAQSERLGVEGQPLELEAEGEGQDTEQTTNTPPSSAEVVPGRTSGGGTNAEGSIGADPLRVPVDERNVVQEYFTP